MRSISPDELNEITRLLSATPSAVRRAVEGVAQEETRWKPSPESFSFVEHVCHLRDIEAEGYSERIRKILAEDNPFLPDLDGSALAIERHYNEGNLNEALAAFISSRERNVNALLGLLPEQLSRTGRLEHAGEVSLSRLVEMMRDHDSEHLRELEELRNGLELRRGEQA